METQPDYVICHYAEVGLKGKNRKFFEEKLVQNIRKALPEGSFRNVRRISGRILVELNRQALQEKAEETLKNVFGLAYFAFAFNAEQNIEAIKQKALEVLKSKRFETFRIDAKRSKKEFVLTSQQINEQVGQAVVERLVKKVKLEDPDITLFCEIVEGYAFLYTQKIAGPGGLPVGISGRAVCLLSGGIDSPVSSFLAMKRGLEVVFVHFHAVPYTDKASVDKVRQLVEILSKYQGRAKLYLIPFGALQKEILLKTKADLRVVLYRRLMLRMAEAIAQKDKVKAIVTGENLGQVASQTLENIGVIEEVSELLILRPLLCYDKEEIIQRAKEIGTYEISILPHQDCCARFLPQHPETRANLREVKREEAKLDVGKLIKEAIKKAQTVEF